ncbi:serine protease gd-like [Chironomus tepperi]|uniref:serine protease gd-like n=1 Tax=Chironomus tepperi TaxID=113505 RepID=UPI00391F7D21
MSYSAYILVIIFTILTPIISQSTASTSTCGKSMPEKGTMINRKFARRGEYPWNVALVDSTDGHYVCGGTLVTSRKIITTAGCIQDKHESKPKLPSMFSALIGAHDLNNSLEIGRTANSIQSVHVHPDWNIKSDDYDADIAVLVLETEVLFNKYIQPACIVQPDTNEAAIAKGVIIGYGKSEDTTKIHENIPKVLEMPIHTNLNCFLKFLPLVQLSSSRTFCAGSANGSGACHGDNGNGLFVYANGLFYLRGIISAGLFNKGKCDVYAYSIFTDVTKYVDWINGVSVE